MRFVVVATLVVAPMAGACTSEPSPMSGSQELALTEEVEATLQGLTEAMNAHDPDLVFSFYRQDESFYYLGCTSVLFGWGTFSSRVRPFYQTRSDLTFQREILSIQILEPTVAVAALRGSSSEAEHLFWTQILQKGPDGRWRVTHEHESWPGCPVPRGPHMGTEGMPGDEMPPAEAGIQGN